MMPKKENAVNLQLILLGYNEAFERLQTGRSTARMAADSCRLYIPLLETLGWADVIEEWINEKYGKKWVKQLPASVHHLEEVIIGFRYARNVVHHRWSTAVELDEQPFLLQDWIWKNNLPSTKPQPTNEAAYKSRLAGRALRHTFKDLHTLYREVEANFS
ncbi:MAG: hypothetical protein BWK73_31490 [Thiothrix lacustris]|uniref:RiboL-PSP-HEPN domain-containing protein n=1 Tax=Thiothrix lacustris TaxID=525917 RepID=A0A1Y1QI22_9GAMM|nr:MAG: hypothetical protein BWK73_31490 [Thiothrix lacustris]